MKHRLLHPLTSSSLPNLAGLTAEYGCEPQYFPRLLYLGLMATLRSPLAWFESARYENAIRSQSIDPAPVFIVGHWRSGTTYLQNLLSEDPQFGRVTLLQAAMPRDFLIFPKSLVGRMQRLLPRTRLMDDIKVSAGAPWEEEMALVSSSRLSFYHVSFFPQAMKKIFDDAVLLNHGDSELVAQWQEEYFGFLKKVQLTQPGKRLLLKNPANTARITLLKQMFPAARFIHIHRNPFEVFASTVHLYMSTQKAWSLQKMDREMIVNHILDTYPRLMEAYFEQRKTLDSNDLVEIGYDDLVRDPGTTLRTIYRQLNINGYDQAVPHLSRYVASQSGYRRNVLSIPAREEDAIRKRWQPIFRELGYATGK
ncbi:MAG: sulfotransferase family protein [Gammaproteobacteria bacterium]